MMHLILIEEDNPIEKKDPKGNIFITILLESMQSDLWSQIMVDAIPVKWPEL